MIYMYDPVIIAHASEPKYCEFEGWVLVFAYRARLGHKKDRRHNVDQVGLVSLFKCGELQLIVLLQLLMVHLRNRPIHW